MKKSIILFLCAFVTLCLCASVNAKTIRRVNNTPSLNDPNVYATAQATHDAAAPNDIISLEPTACSSYTCYGGLTVTKRIDVVGPGYFRDKNPNNFFDLRYPPQKTFPLLANESIHFSDYPILMASGLGL